MGKKKNKAKEWHAFLSYKDDTGEWLESNAVGKKFDSDKPRMDLLPFDALLEVSRVLALGASKYGDDNWRLVEPISRYEAAMLRHLAAHKMGEETDPESGLSHLAHVACNALFLLARRK